MCLSSVSLFFFFNDTATTEIYTLSLHDALPICRERVAHEQVGVGLSLVAEHLDRVVHAAGPVPAALDHSDGAEPARDRKSTRLNSSHVRISYAVFCLKKKNN